MKTLEQPKSSLSGQAMALISHGCPDPELYKLVIQGMEYELRAAEQRGIERAANLMFLQGHESVISTKQAYNAIRALAQGGEE